MTYWREAPAKNLDMELNFTAITTATASDRSVFHNVSYYEMGGADPGYTLRFGVTTTALLSVAYGMVFLLGLVGNGFVVAVVCRCRAMRSPTNLFIVNLACADLLVIVLCLPFTLVGNLVPAWILGGVICKALPYLQGVSVSASINTLMAISIERCVAITSLTLRGPMTPRQCCMAVIAIWSFALFINLPWIMVFTMQPIGLNGSVALICTEMWPDEQSENMYFLLANLCICYLVPLALISVCYLLIWRRLSVRKLPGEASGGQGIINKSKIKAIKMILVVIVTFALSWLPLYTIFTLIKFGLINMNSEHSEHVVLALLPLTQWLGAANSCVNPIYYAFFNRKFRVGFRAILTSKSCCGPLRYDGRFASYYNNSYKCSNINVTVTSIPMAQINREKYTQTRHLMESLDSTTVENSSGSKRLLWQDSARSDDAKGPVHQSIIANGVYIKE